MAAFVDCYFFFGIGFRLLTHAVFLCAEVIRLQLRLCLFQWLHIICSLHLDLRLRFLCRLQLDSRRQLDLRLRAAFMCDLDLRFSPACRQYQTFRVDLAFRQHFRFGIRFSMSLMSLRHLFKDCTTAASLGTWLAYHQMRTVVPVVVTARYRAADVIVIVVISMTITTTYVVVIADVEDRQPTGTAGGAWIPVIMSGS